MTACTAQGMARVRSGRDPGKLAAMEEHAFTAAVRGAGRLVPAAASLRWVAGELGDL